LTVEQGSGGNGSNGSTNDLPWATVFDPAANARALSAIQAQGFRAASRVVDRFAQLAETTIDGATRPSAAGNGAGATPALNPNVDLIVTTWWSMIGQMFRAMRGDAPAVSGDTVTVDVANDAAAGCVQLEVCGAGHAAAEVWLHNSGPNELGDAVMRCSSLLAHTGDAIDAGAVAFVPAVVPLPARSSRGVRVEVDVAAGTTPTRYRGTVLVSGHPDVWLPLVLTVRPAG
jgi:hypothetical protein